MERELHDAAMEGNVTSLRNLCRQNPLIFDKYIITYSTETPLHIAAILGHLEFATELLKLKPELASELNSTKSTSLHLASTRKNVEMVRLLLSANPQMCHARDGCGWNPLHVAAMKGRVDVLRELVRVRSGAACVPIDSGSHETILHVCVKHNQLEALKLLLAETVMGDNAEFMNSKDGDGNTILHLAVLDKQFQTIDFLRNIPSIDVNAKNVFGHTALDLSKICLKDASSDYLHIRQLLQPAGAMNSRSNVSSETTGVAANMSSTAAGGSTLQEILDKFLSKQEEWHKQQQKNGRLESHRNAIMITASLIAAVTFQAGANPPGSFWQENSNSSDTSTNPYIAGQSKLAYNFPGLYKIMVYSNATAFFTSAYVFLLLLSGLPLNNRLCTGILMVAMWIAIVAAGFSFLISMEATGFGIRTVYQITPPEIIAYFAIFGIILLGHIGQFLLKMVRRCGRRHRSTSPTAAPANGNGV